MKKSLKRTRTLRPCFEINYEELKFEKEIAQGAFGQIFRGKWRETTVAIKLLKKNLMKEETIKDFLNECYAMESLRHPNIVMFMGACTKFPNLAIVLEYCPNKSLWSLLQNKNIILHWEDRRRLAIDMAKGMNYLHSFAVPVLHRDLKSLNILIDDSYRPKIADFGWTRLKAEKMTEKIGTFQWMAPEVLKTSTYTEKADVFSFAIILWEMAAREPPFKNINAIQVAKMVLLKDLRPTIPKDTPPQFASLMKRCWDRNPALRPSFNKILYELEAMRFKKKK